jgi:hypothetical protein
MDEVRAWLEHGAAPSVPSVPRDQTKDLTSMQDVLHLAERRWPDQKCEPPNGMSARSIQAEMEAFPHGITQLLEATSRF